MSDGSEKSGFYVSGALHAALLAMILVGFSQAPKFDDAAESIPVDTISQSQFNEIMHGEKDAKPAKTPPAPAPRPMAEAAPSVPTPPEPPPDLRRVDDAPPDPPPPPVKPPPEPPVKKPPPEPPAPPPKPVAEDAPEPPVKTKVVEKPPEKIKPEPPERPKPEPQEKSKPDSLAKLVAKAKSEAPPKEPAKLAVKTYDPNAIAKLLGQTKTADASPTGSTPQGLPTQHAARMSPSLSSALDAWLTEAYLGCWSPPPAAPDGERYVADVRVIFNPDGSLSGQPVLLNPPRDPAWRAHAESAMRAVLKCNPMRVPPQYAPYFEQWKTKTIHFDPQDALG